MKRMGTREGFFSTWPYGSLFLSKSGGVFRLEGTVTSFSS